MLYLWARECGTNEDRSGAMTIDSGRVMTVLGSVDPDQLGVTMTHEHLFDDLGCWQAPPRTPLQEKLADAPLSIEFLGELRRDALVFSDNLLLDDEEITFDELRDLVDAGGRSLVDVTVTGLEPRVEKLRRLAERVDLHIVAGCGYYIRDSHPASVGTSSLDAITNELLEQIHEGIGETGVRPGVIGEIGTGQPVDKDEWKVLEAACNAQKASGLPIFIHIYPFGDGNTAPEVVKFVLDHGVQASRVNICHMDGRPDIDYLTSVLETGVFVSFDTFGLEAYYDSIDRRSSFDAEREAILEQVLERGFAAQLLLSQDVCMKMQLRRFGGHGYSHILRHIVPSLRRRGLDESMVDLLLRDNPMRLLTIVE